MKSVEISNNLFSLAESLADLIKSNKDPFKTINVIVPNTRVEQFFKAYWLKKSSDVLMNITFKNLDDALFNSIIANDVDENNFPIHYCRLGKSDEVSILINLLSSLKRTEENKDIYDYLFNGRENQKCIRIYDIATSLSNIFADYDSECFEYPNWQKDIYDEMINKAKSLITKKTSLRNLFENGKVKENGDYIFFEFIGFSKLETKIIEKLDEKNNVVVFKLEENNSIKNELNVASAPSKLREIECVHSQICSMIEKDKNLKLSDFVVVAPSISEYENCISQVFIQHDKKFPNIPFSVNGVGSNENDVCNVLNRLMDIYLKGFYTRFDFLTLVSAVSVQQTRDITNEDVNAWSDAIINMNVYRNRDGSSDWDYAKKRLLASKLTEETVCLKDGEFSMYSSIDLNNESLHKFISVINDLDDLIVFSKSDDYKFATEDALKHIRYFLDKWISRSSYPLSYKKIGGCFDLWIENNLCSDSIPLSTFFSVIQNAAKINTCSSGKIYTNGVSFVDFNTNYVLPAKVVFFIGASSSAFPKTMLKSEIDFREDKDNIIKHNFINEQKKAFNILYQCSESFFISYVDKNLKTDEDFYPSTFLIDLYERVFGCKIDDKNPMKKKTLSLDEDRDWSELYTKKEYKNKDYFSGLFITKGDTEESPKEVFEYSLEKKISVSKIAKFLSEPLSFKAKSIFGQTDDNDEKIHDEYEPFFPNILDSSAIVKNGALKVLLNDGMELDDLGLEKNLDHKLPFINDSVLNRACRDIRDDIDIIRKFIKKLFGEFGDNCKVRIVPDLCLKTEKGDEWICTNETPAVIKEEENDLWYFQIKRISKKTFTVDTTPEEFSFLYVLSLLDIANRDEEKSYNVHLVRQENPIVVFTVSPKESRYILNQIYELICDFNNNKYIPQKYLLAKEEGVTLNKLIDDILKENGSWRYFDDKKMFDIPDDIGFDKHYYPLAEKMRNLIIYVKNRFEEKCKEETKDE